jgi:hypothetical protein
LWNQEPAVSKGGQANLTLGPIALSLSFTDGFDSGVYNWVTGSATWTINSANSFEFVVVGNVEKPMFRPCARRCRKTTRRSSI